MATDNKSAHQASKYDLETGKTIPYYTSIHDETINFIRSLINTRMPGSIPVVELIISQ